MNVYIKLDNLLIYCTNNA